MHEGHGPFWGIHIWPLKLVSTSKRLHVVIFIKLVIQFCISFFHKGPKRCKIYLDIYFYEDFSETCNPTIIASFYRHIKAILGDIRSVCKKATRYLTSSGYDTVLVTLIWCFFFFLSSRDLAEFWTAVILIGRYLNENIDLTRSVETGVCFVLFSLVNVVDWL